jgi:hypothetical protein
MQNVLLTEMRRVRKTANALGELITELFGFTWMFIHGFWMCLAVPAMLIVGIFSPKVRRILNETFDH